MNDEDNSRKQFRSHPMDAPGCYARFNTWWIFKLFYIGYKRDLNDADLYECLREDRSEKIHCLFKRLWKEEQTHTNASILRVIWHAYGTTILSLAFLCVFVDTICRIAEPQFMGLLLSTFSPGSDNHGECAYYYTLGVLICSTIPTIFLQLALIWFSHIAIKLKVGICCLIYEKVLKMTKSTSVDGFNGRAINLMANDTAKIEAALIFSFNLIRGPLHAIVLGYFIYREIGISGVIGVALMLTSIPFQSKRL